MSLSQHTQRTPLRARLTSLGDLVADTIAVHGRPKVHYVIARNAWIFHWIAQYITADLRERRRVPARVTYQPWTARGQVLHFGDRYQFLAGPYRRLRRRNAVVLTWFHTPYGSEDAFLPTGSGEQQDLLAALDRILVSCSASRSALLESGVPAEQVVQIPLGVELARFRPAPPDERAARRRELGLPSDAFVIGSFQKDGSGFGDGLEPKLVKGPDVLLATVGHLDRQGCRPTVLLTGPARGYVKAGLTERGIPFVHRTIDDYRDIVGCYHAVDACLIASRAEGGPMMLAESWATGVPVVSTNMGMPADLVRHGENGLLAPVEDAAGLAEHLAALAAEPELRQRLAAQALQDVRPLDWGCIAGRYYEGLYRPLLGRFA